MRAAGGEGGGERDEALDLSRAVRGEVSLRLDPLLSSVATARSAVADLAAGTGVPAAVAEDGALVVSELVTNAVLHARSQLDLRVEADLGSLRIEVADRSEDPVEAPPGAPPAPAADVFDEPPPTDLDALIDALATTGRGLTLVAALARSWGVSPLAGGGKVVWAVLDPASQAEAGPGGSAAAQPVVRLVAVPVRLIVESDQLFDDALRELQVLAMSRTAPPELEELAARAAGSRDLLRALRLTGQPEVRTAIERGDRLVDVHLAVPADLDTSLERLAVVLGEIEVARRAGLLLAVGPDPEVVAWRRWLRAEALRQLEGGAVQPCPFPVLPAAGPARDQVPLSERRQALLERLRADLDDAGGAVAAAAVRRVAADTGAAFVSLLLVEPDGRHVSLADRIGYPPDEVHGRRYPVADDNPISEAVRTARPVVLRTPEERTERYPALVPSAPVAANPTAVWVPLGSSAPALGALVAGFSRARDFTDADLRFLLQVGEELRGRLARS